MKDNKSSGFRACDWFYPVVLAAYVLALFFQDVVRPGVVSAIMLMIVVFQLLLTNGLPLLRGLHKSSTSPLDGLHNSKNSPLNGLHNSKSSFLTEDIILTLWLFFNLLSGIWCVGFGLPLSVYLGEVFTTALPMCFYYCGRQEAAGRPFSCNYLISVAGIGLIGIVLFITGPQIYIDYLMKLELISKADIPTMRVRMHSVIGSTLLGFLAAVGIPVSVRMVLESSGRKGKILAAASGLFMLLLAFLSNQRSAMAAAIFVIVFFNFLVFFEYKLFPKKFFAAECAAIVLFAAGLFLVFRGAFMKVYYRLVSLPGSIAQRSDQWVGAANNMKSIWLGNGLGANGHRAIGFSDHVIADGGIAKLYVESGIIGTSLFVFLMLLILKKGLKNSKLTAPEVCIILVTLLMSIGSNMMSFALSVPVFYYYAGRCVSLYNTAVSPEKDSVPAERAEEEGGGI
ncbi:MAG: hypothetical protein K5668_11020 [Lachnospiraceae bacterium]|nr:hypothetical protein [Lachnospiraceae bacterium]